MSALLWILVGGTLMSAIALSGSLTLLLPAATLQRVIGPLISLAAGTLLGGAFLHLLPAGATVPPVAAGAWVLAGFTTFLALEQLLQWHQCHRVGTPQTARSPEGYLILIGDGLHNFLGGLGIGSTFLVNPAAGVSAWVAAAAHEVPQELGDFGVLVHGGWARRSALLWNLASGLTFLAGGIVAWVVSRQVDVTPLVLFGAGNFLYIGAADLVPEFKVHPSLGQALESLACFAVGVGAMWGLAVVP